MGCWRVLKERSLMMSSVKESTVKQPPPSGWNKGPCSNNPKWALSTQKSLKSSLTSLICAPGALFNWSKQRFPKHIRKQRYLYIRFKVVQTVSIVSVFIYVIFYFKCSEDAVSTLHNLSLKQRQSSLYFPDLKTRFCLLKSDTSSHFLYFFFFQSTLAA